MPTMGGLEVLRALRGFITAPFPVLMLTAETDIDVARSALDCGATAYITKPFDFEVLRREIKRLLEKTPQKEQDKSYRPWRVE